MIQEHRPPTPPGSVGGVDVGFRRILSGVEGIRNARRSGRKRRADRLRGPGHWTIARPPGARAEDFGNNRPIGGHTSADTDIGRGRAR
jgi:hypothetical protein